MGQNKERELNGLFAKCKGKNKYIRQMRGKKRLANEERMNKKENKVTKEKAGGCVVMRSL